MKQETLNTAFNSARNLNIMADVSHGLNLVKHQKSIQESLEAVELIIEQEGYLQPDIGDILYMKDYFIGMAEHIEKGLADANYRPDIMDWIKNNSPGN